MAVRVKWFYSFYHAIALETPRSLLCLYKIYYILTCVCMYVCVFVCVCACVCECVSVTVYCACDKGNNYWSQYAERFFNGILIFQWSNFCWKLLSLRFNYLISILFLIQFFSIKQIQVCLKAYFQKLLNKAVIFFKLFMLGGNKRSYILKKTCII